MKNNVSINFNINVDEKFRIKKNVLIVQNKVEISTPPAAPMSDIVFSDTQDISFDPILS